MGPPERVGSAGMTSFLGAQRYPRFISLLLGGPDDRRGWIGWSMHNIISRTPLTDLPISFAVASNALLFATNMVKPAADLAD